MDFALDNKGLACMVYPRFKQLDFNYGFRLCDWLIVISIVFSGVMTSGYAIIDELLIGFIIAGLVLSRKIPYTVNLESNLEEIHQVLFSVFVIYQY